MDKKIFYDTIRPKVNLTTQNVFGMEKCLDYLEERVKLGDDINVNKAAYAIATGWWESSQTMWPVKEAYWMSESWRMKNLRYYPYYGRGLIQTTWERNYRKIGELLGVDLVKYPYMLLEWNYALPAWWIGMRDGLYTGKKVDDYIDDVDESDEEDFKEYKNARRVVNAMDKASTIAKLALLFEKALRKSGFGKAPVIACKGA